MSSPLASTRRITADPRFESHIAYIQSALVLSLAEGAPSFAAITRRAVALFAEHISALAEAGRKEGLRGLRDQDAAAERTAMHAAAGIINAPLPKRHTDDHGRLLTWAESIR